MNTLPFPGPGSGLTIISHNTLLGLEPPTGVATISMGAARGDAVYPYLLAIQHATDRADVLVAGRDEAGEVRAKLARRDAATVADLITIGSTRLRQVVGLTAPQVGNVRRSLIRRGVRLPVEPGDPFFAAHFYTAVEDVHSLAVGDLGAKGPTRLGDVLSMSPDDLEAHAGKAGGIAMLRIVGDYADNFATAKRQIKDER